VLLLGERPGAGALAGLLLILAGSYLSTGGRLPGRRTARARDQPVGEHPDDVGERPDEGANRLGRVSRLLD
jgi:hypothetical protein